MFGYIENGTLGMAPESLGETGLKLPYVLLGNYASTFRPWLVKPYFRRQLTREERIWNYRISRGGRRVVENVFGILDLGSYWAQHCFDMRCVAQHA